MTSVDASSDFVPIMCNVGYIVVGRLALTEEVNKTLYTSEAYSDVSYGLGPAVVSVSLFDGNAKLLQYKDGDPIRISFSIKVNAIPYASFYQSLLI